MKAVEVQDLFKHAVQFGHKKSKWNPKMKRYIFAEKDGIHIINIEKTKALLDEACAFLKNAATQGKNLLVVGTKAQASTLVKKFAQEMHSPYIAEKWPAGLLTNWDAFSRRLKDMDDLRDQLESGELEERYTKKEVAQFRTEYMKLDRALGGLRGMTRLPDVMFVVDPLKEKLAVKEARLKKIPVVAIVDTNADPDYIQHVIPANDDAMQSLEIVLSCVKEAWGTMPKGTKAPLVKKMALDEKPEGTEATA